MRHRRAHRKPHFARAHAASIRATKQSSSEFSRATTDTGDANRMEGGREASLLLLPHSDSDGAMIRWAGAAAEFRPREQRATDAGEAPRLLLPSESGGLDLRSRCSSTASVGGWAIETLAFTRDCGSLSRGGWSSKRRVVHRTGRRFGGPFEALLPHSDPASGAGRAGAQPLSTNANTSPSTRMLCALCTAMLMSALR